MQYLPLVMGPIMIFGGLGLIYLWFAMRPLDLQIAAMEADTAKIEQQTEIIRRETAEKYPDFKY
jgi:hypothetical protein